MSWIPVMRNKYVGCKFLEAFSDQGPAHFNPILIVPEHVLA